ncbi:MAG: peptide-methionine (S)-S-oxide reductase MsrA [Chloroflexota bacterium]
MLDTDTKTLQKATFGAGCFWGIEETFRHVPGVQETAVGYSGGTLENPTYELVCSGRTGHAEVVQVTYDPAQLSYEDLLHVFWNAHNPTTRNRQGWDIGTQYRSVIFFHTPEQERIAIISKAAQQPSGFLNRKIVTEITPAGPFYRAEEYHQRYLAGRGAASCRV